MSDHITEEQIQLYLDNKDDTKFSSIRDHLDACPSCMKNVERYDQLYIALNLDPFPALPEDFSRELLSKIAGSQKSRYNIFESGFTIAFFLFGIAASLYFVNPLPFISKITNSTITYLSEITSKFLPELNGNTPIFIVAILIFLLVELIDKKVLRSRS
jgi:hypothetical protein